MMKNKDKVLQLRREGKSYNEIRREIRISKSTLSEWLRPLEWSRNITDSLIEQSKKTSSIRIQTLNRIRGEHLKRVYVEARQEAVEEFHKLKYHPMFIAAIMLYWGEGDRVNKYLVRISNVDPAMIHLFKNFLLHVCQAPESRVRANLLIYPDLDDNVCKEYWAKEAGLGKEKFTKSIVIKGRHETRRLRYGVCTIWFPNRYLKEKMLIWVKLLPRELLSDEYYLYKK